MNLGSSQLKFRVNMGSNEFDFWIGRIQVINFSSISIEWIVRVFRVGSNFAKYNYRNRCFRSNPMTTFDILEFALSQRLYQYIHKDDYMSKFKEAQNLEIFINC